jgi:hypothetical protein
VCIYGSSVYFDIFLVGMSLFSGKGCVRKETGRVRFSDGCDWIAGDRICATCAATFVNFEHVRDYVGIRLFAG